MKLTEESRKPEKKELISDEDKNKGNFHSYKNVSTSHNNSQIKLEGENRLQIIIISDSTQIQEPNARQ